MTSAMGATAVDRAPASTDWPVGVALVVVVTGVALVVVLSPPHVENINALAELSFK